MLPSTPVSSVTSDAPGSPWQTLATDPSSRTSGSSSCRAAVARDGECADRDDEAADQRPAWTT